MAASTLLPLLLLLLSLKTAAASHPVASAADSNAVAYAADPHGVAPAAAHHGFSPAVAYAADLQGVSPAAGTHGVPPAAAHHGFSPAVAYAAEPQGVSPGAGTHGVAPPAATILSAAKALTDTGHLSVALGLQLAANAGLGLGTSKATVFAPPDTAFVRSRPPSLPLLLYHISPERVNFETLARGQKIETMRSNYTITVTASLADDGYTSLNGVKVDQDPVIDDGFVAIYQVAGLLVGKNRSAESVKVSAVTAPAKPPLGDILRSLDCSVFATLVESQLGELRGTLFAEVDDDVETAANFSSDYSVIFRSRFLPQRLGWEDLIDLEEGSLLETFAGSQKPILVTKKGGLPVLNGDVEVVRREIFQSELFVVHLVRSPGSRNSGFFAGGCKKVEEAEHVMTTVAHVINMVFAVFALMVVVYIVVANASFTPLQDKNEGAAVPDDPNQKPTTEEKPKPSMTAESKPQPQMPSTSEEQKPNEEDPKKKPRKKTLLDAMIEARNKRRAAREANLASADDATEKLRRAYEYTVEQCAFTVPFAATYFLIRLVWTAFGRYF